MLPSSSTPILLLLTTVGLATAYTVTYRLHENNDMTVNECVERAMDTLMEETCLIFDRTNSVVSPNAVDFHHPNTVLFVQSAHCAWQATNRTVHLSPECITEDTCFEILAKVLDVDRPRKHISRHLNIKYNCSDRCNLECEHGGTVTSDCRCECAYGFTGKNCEDLAREEAFTDDACGRVTNAYAGVIQLSSYPSEFQKSTFCQWLIKSDDPWSIVELEWTAPQDLDADELPPGQHCNDLLSVYGAEGVRNPFPCDGTAHPTGKIRSTGNWLLIELRTNPWALRGHKGPHFTYRLQTIPHAIKVFSDEMTSFGAPLTTITSALIAFVYRLL